MYARSFVLGTALSLAGAALSLMAGCNEPEALGERRSQKEAVRDPGLPRVAPPFLRGGDDGARTVRVNIQPTGGSTLQGRAVLTERADGVWIEAEFTSAPPGRHGLHIHEKPDCRGGRAEGAGEHFSPEAKKHGLPDEGEHHLGDLGNVVVDGDGVGRVERLVPTATLQPGQPRSLLGRSIVLAAPEDRGAAQPPSSSERKIGCGVVVR